MVTTEAQVRAQAALPQSPEEVAGRLYEASDAVQLYRAVFRAALPVYEDLAAAWSGLHALEGALDALADWRYALTSAGAQARATAAEPIPYRVRQSIDTPFYGGRDEQYSSGEQGAL